MQSPSSGEGTDLPLVILVGAAAFVTTFDITAVAMIMPSMRRDLALDIRGFAWLMDSYSLAFTMCLMTAGLLADRFGRRRSFIAGNAVFLAASLACAFAPDVAWLLAGRVAQGAGAAFLVCAGLALVGHRFPDRAQRVRAIGLLGVLNGAAMAFGPAGGGLIAALAGWHWVFLINVPICLGLALAAPRVAAESRDPAQRPIDAWGVICLSLLLVCAVWLLMHGPRAGAIELPWPAAAAVLVLLAAALVSSQRRAAAPLFPPALLARPAFLGISWVHVALSVGYWAVLVYLPLFLQERLGQSLQSASLLMLAATLPMAVLPPLAVRLAATVRPAVLFGGGLAVVAGAGLLLALASRVQSLPLALAGMLVGGCGTAGVSALALAGIVNAVPREQAGAASAVTIILRQGGFAVGLALLAAVGARSWTAVDSYAALFLAAAGTAGLSAVLVAALLRGQRD